MLDWVKTRAALFFFLPIKLLPLGGVQMRTAHLLWSRRLEGHPERETRSSEEDAEAKTNTHSFRFPPPNSFFIRLLSRLLSAASTAREALFVFPKNVINVPAGLGLQVRPP